MKIHIFGCFLLAFPLVFSLTVNSYFTPTDRENAKSIFFASFNTNDPANIHYGAIGLKRLKEPIPASSTQCKTLVEVSKNPKLPTEVIYHIAIAHKVIQVCPEPLEVINLVKQLNAVLTSDVTLQEIFHASQALVALSQKPTDIPKLIKYLQAAIKKNDSVANLGYLFHICAAVGAEGAFGFDRIEDALVQADEIDGSLLQFEGGLSITALVINGALKLSNALNKSPPITNDQITKFANYFLTRKSVQSSKGMANLVTALENLSNNKYQIPVAVNIVSSSAVSSENPRINVKISNVLGESLGALTVTADSATRIADDVVVLSKKKFEPTSDKTVFGLNLYENKPEKGQYKLTVSAALTQPDPRIPSTISTVITIKVLTYVGIDFVGIGVTDSDQSSPAKLQRVPFGKSAEKVIEADAQQKIQLRFSLKDQANNKPLTVHQAFLRFQQPEAAESVTFIAEPDSTSQYRLDLDLGLKGADFNFQSGIYEAELIIGDAVLTNSFSWKLATFKLSFTGEPKVSKQQDSYKPKPEIEHLFREPEKRPPRFVSDLFSVLSALPLLILIVLWIRLKINVSNFRFSISTLCFHAGLASIFTLFACFWLKLNMFETVKYLLGLGIFTYVSGVSLLRKISNSREAAEKRK